MASFTVLGKLREDSLTTTYRAVRSADNRHVIVKVLETSATPQDVERLRRELELGRAPDCPVILRALELDSHEGRPALVVEDPGGEPLARSLGAVPMSPGQFLTIALGLAEALAALHACGLVHGALTADSFFVSTSPAAVRLTDVGGASRGRSERSPLRPGRAVDVSLPYMSPEQTGRMNRPVDARSDLYSLGVIFFRMLTGRLPFSAIDPLGWVHAQLARRAPAPTELVPSTPPQLSELVLKLLAKLPEERYQSAEGVAHDLARCLRDWQGRGRIAPFPLAQRDWSGRLDGRGKLQGRGSQLAELGACTERLVARGGAELVLVVGSAGTGKSSLVQEHQSSIVGQQGPFASAKFDRLRRDVPYAALLQACEQLLAQALAETDERLEAWRRLLDERLGPNAPLLVQLLPELGHILGPRAPAPDLPVAEAERRHFLAFAQLLGAFTRPGRPLTIFFDDLQWADPTTLRLLEHLLRDPQVRPLLLLGAYRDNEVTDAHPLAETLRAARSHGVPVHTIAVGPLPVTDVERIVADVLRAPVASVRSLARLVHGRTGGNPYFVLQFLTTLEARGLLSFDRGAGEWRWDSKRIAAERITDNVVELVAARVTQLPAATQELLRLCACFGSTVAEATLAAITGQEAPGLAATLAPALDADLLVRVDGSLRFTHDRVHEAAYSLVPERERPSTHLRLGRLLLARTPIEQLDRELFEIVDQLSRGSRLIEARSERVRLAALELQAARKARASAAFASALGHLRRGIECLPPDAGEDRDELAFDLHFEEARCSFGAGRTRRARELLTALREQARSRRQLADVTGLEVGLDTLEGDLTHAVAVTLDCLRLFGIDWPPHPERATVLAEQEELERALAGRPIEQLTELPRMEDPDALAVMCLLAAVHSPALFTDQELLALVTCRKVNLGLRHGNADSSSHAYSTLGMLVGPVFGRYGDAPRWARVALALIDRGADGSRARVLVDASLACQWERPLRENLRLLDGALLAAKQTGDLTFACYTRNLGLTLLLALGDPLDEVERAADEALEFVRGVGFGLVETILMSQRLLIRRLRGQDADEADEGRIAAALEGSPAFAIAACWHEIWTLQARYLADDLEGALRAAERAQALLWTSPSFVEVSEFYFFHALALAAHPAPSASARATLRDRVQLLGEWARLCPENFADKHALVAAELARAEGDHDRASRLYDEAIRAARDGGFPHHVALAQELASRCYRARGFDFIADAYVREARAGYGRWGAARKLQQLGHLAPWPDDRTVCSAATATIAIPEQLDLLSIVKASQLVSREIDRERLLRTLLTVVLEQGGARTARLLLFEGRDLTVAAGASVSDQGVETTLPGSAQRPLALPDVPHSIVNYARRTRARVVLDDVAQDPGAFRGDEYLARRRPRSLLCLPILREDEVHALLLLENELAPGAFTAVRLVALELLASQAAISFENARLLESERKAQREARFLADVSKAIVGSLDLGETLGRLARLAVPFLADWCVVDVVEGGVVRRIAGAHVDPSKEPLLQELARHVGWGKQLRPGAHALVTGETFVAPALGDEDIRAMAHDEAHADLVRALAPRAVVAVPLVASGRRLGALTVCSSRPATFGPGTVALAEEVARRAAVAVEHAELYQEARAAIRQRDEFLSMASHELRTPVTSLLLTVQGLARGDKAASPEAVRRVCGLIERQARRLTQLIEEMLCVGRLHVGRLGLRLTDVDLVQVVRDVVESLGPLLVRARCPVDLRAPLPVIGRWDPEKLAHVITNLLSNALKFGEGALIEVTVQAAGPSALLTVTDHGVGIAPDTLPHVFEKFERGVSARNYGGLGVGLFIVQEVVHALGGAVRVESVPGDHTTFTVELPLEGPRVD